MGAVIQLVPAGVSLDTIAALEALLDAARDGGDLGPLLGVAYVGIYKARNYVVDVAGEARESPLFAHSLVALLAHELIRIHRGGRY